MTPEPPRFGVEPGHFGPRTGVVSATVPCRRGSWRPSDLPAPQGRLSFSGEFGPAISGRLVRTGGNLRRHIRCCPPAGPPAPTGEVTAAARDAASIDRAKVFAPFPSR